MAHYGTLRDFRFSDHADDIRGAALYGNDDEKLGDIADVIFDHQSGAIQYVVIETGGWLHARRFLVPANRVEPRGANVDEYRVNLTRKQIEDFPPYDENHLRDDEKWKDYEDQYRRASGWTDAGDVLHQEGTTRIITPDPTTVSSDAPHIAAGEHATGLEPNRLPRQSAGPMNTSATAWGQTPDNLRLHESGMARPGSNQKVSDSAEATNLDRDRKLESQPDLKSPIQGTQTVSDDLLHTVEGDSLLNNEDIRHLHHEHIDDPDRGSRIEGGGTVGSGSYLSANTGTRWSRFENRLRQQRATATSGCSVCEALKNRHREDAA